LPTVPRIVTIGFRPNSLAFSFDISMDMEPPSLSFDELAALTFPSGL